MRDTSHHQQLRDWAKGMYPLEAATELLLRSFGGRFAETNLPWIVRNDFGDWAVDWERLYESAVLAGPYSGGERRMLGICASLGWSGAKLALTDVLTGLDTAHIRLVLAAVSHASGVQEFGGEISHVTDLSGKLVGVERGARPGVLFPWPEDDQ